MVPLFSLSAAGPNRAASELGLRRLAANLAHNINNTLTGVIGYLELALRETLPESSTREHLQRSLTCSHRMAEMLRRILAFAFHAASAGGLVPVSLRRVTEQLAASVGAPGLTVVVRAEAEGLIRANTPLLLMALDQLISNALEAMPDGGTLTIRVGEADGRPTWSISDTGRGMSAEAQAHLFEPFFTTKITGHLGLGLALSRDVVEAMGGSIGIVSREGEGTTVTLSFPPAEPARRPELPIDERIGRLLSGRLTRPAGPHFRLGPPAEPALDCV